MKSEPTPLQKKLDEFGHVIVKICFVLVGLVFVLQWLRGGTFVEVFLTAVSLAVAAIPEGLPAVVTIALALGVQRMVKRHALIRKLPSVETLGCATVICSDKTGTLTRNEMTVRAVYAGGRLFQVSGVGYEPRGEITLGGAAVSAEAEPELRETLTCGVLCNGANLLQDGGVWRIAGDPTEGAILTVAAKRSLTKTDLEREHPLVEEIPFDSERKMMSMIRTVPGGRLAAFVKGAPDVLLRNCTAFAEGGTRKRMTPADSGRILDANDDLSNQAMRVLALAVRDLEPASEAYSSETVESGLTFLGLVAMIDPPREEAKAAIRTCKFAGIRAVMITGDHKNTAVAIARELGLATPDSTALSGEELDRIPDDALARQVESIPVYARVSPEHKLRIVRAWRKLGHVVAMTGDGVNDAPAVKEADIGVAMGITGTDVTKEVSDMVVTDDNFASIVAAVEEGRGIYDNILKFVHYLLSCNAGEIMVMFFASLFGMPMPLLPIHILWVNLVTDGLPALALGLEPAERDTMKRPPRRSGASIFGGGLGWQVLWLGLLMGVVSLGAAEWFARTGGHDLARPADAAYYRTLVFTLLTFLQMANVLAVRSERQSLFAIGIWSNRPLVGAVALTTALQLALIYMPALQTFFRTVPLSGRDLAVCALLGTSAFWAVEGEKWIRRRMGR